jgi:DNA-directed RNA polymerase specialized sigma24 family protein
MHGDRDAFTQLAAQYSDRCYALAYRILRDAHRAQDATQQALFGAWRDLQLPPTT